ncbi:UDP-glucose dehydrogenase family protein [Nocardia sp. NPDC060259]|uniref:UDP-glucose dehydrogenase family protein n=1 Tax=Nocardia sp. NPDC060259 TaxID=3347088 RepID=UPI00364C9EDA
MDRNEHIVVLGAGYVGLTTAVCLAHLGYTVDCVDHDPALVHALSTGHAHLDEPRLEDLLVTAITSAKISFTTTLEPVTRSSIVIVCLPTPASSDGSADISAIEQAITDLRDLLSPNSIIAIKSTVPVGTNSKLHSRLGRKGIALIANPEFLREGHAVNDFLSPNRVVIGGHDAVAVERFQRLYRTFECPMIVTDPASAELAKYAANAFLATKISFINSIATMCDALGADIDDIERTLTTDPRIGAGHLTSGPGWGGPCLPKDTASLIHQSATAGLRLPLIEAALATNTQRIEYVIESIQCQLGVLTGRRIATLGATFKVGTTDCRDSPALRIINQLHQAGAIVSAHDPCLATNADLGFQIFGDPYQAINHADIVVILTAWPQYRELDWHEVARTMHGHTIVDTCRVADSHAVRLAGMKLHALGRGAPYIKSTLHQGNAGTEELVQRDLRGRRPSTTRHVGAVPVQQPRVR